MKTLLKIWDGLFRVDLNHDKDPLWTLATTEYRDNPYYAYTQLKKGMRP
jgi:hypothetical protein